MPAASSRAGFTPQIRFKSAISNGMTAMNATTSPEPIDTSASAVPPMPPPSISAPTTSALRHCRRVGQGVPRQRIHAASSTPATRKREPICRNGGKLISAYLMAR
ncbi:hypothetical protein D9M69_641120 [compost metagenome]